MNFEVFVVLKFRISVTWLVVLFSVLSGYCGLKGIYTLYPQSVRLMPYDGVKMCL